MYCQPSHHFLMGVPYLRHIRKDVNRQSIINPCIASGAIPIQSCPRRTALSFQNSVNLKLGPSQQQYVRGYIFIFTIVLSSFFIEIINKKYNKLLYYSLTSQFVNMLAIVFLESIKYSLDCKFITATLAKQFLKSTGTWTPCECKRKHIHLTLPYPAWNLSQTPSAHPVYALVLKEIKCLCSNEVIHQMAHNLSVITPKPHHSSRIPSIYPFSTPSNYDGMPNRL